MRHDPARCQYIRIDSPARFIFWTVQQRSCHNKATCALANKLARICYAVLRDHEPYEAAKLNNKLHRAAYAVPI